MLEFNDIISFLTLSSLEIILGIDNIIFLAILVHPIPAYRRNKVRIFGLSLAIALRILMLFGVSWIMGLTKPLFLVLGQEFSGRSLMLLAGGLFLVFKGFYELVDMFKEAKREGKLKDSDDEIKPSKRPEWRIILQIIFVDLILSFDSVIVAVGMNNKIHLIIAAIFVAMFVMLVASKAIGDFMYKNPSIKVIGIFFILLVGLFLTADGIGFALSKQYLYAAIFFSLTTEAINIKLKNLRG
jgi:predicted tellurium resistance membrane protein TerC